MGCWNRASVFKIKIVKTCVTEGQYKNCMVDTWLPKDQGSKLNVNVIQVNLWRHSYFSSKKRHHVACLWGCGMECLLGVHSMNYILLFPLSCHMFCLTQLLIPAGDTYFWFQNSHIWYWVIMDSVTRSFCHTLFHHKLWTSIYTCVTV